MALIIGDTNIFIDMECGGLLRAMFRLEETFAVPDIVYREELQEEHADLPGLGLQILHLTAESVQHLTNLRNRYPKPSFNDLSAVALAHQEETMLVTGDASLRKAAEAEVVEVHGTIWLVEQMLGARIITETRANDAYDAMREERRRLPWDEVDAQLDRWR